MTTQELRDSFLISGLFKENELVLEYCEIERAVVGSAVPGKKPIKLEAGKELAADYFCRRREAGVLNIGGAGKISVDGAGHDMQKLDVLYIGRGSKEVLFESSDPSSPARFYILSYPAHADHPTCRAGKADAEPVRLGSQEESNLRTIYKCIHPDGIKSCQLVMGFTILEPGSVWNTMPAHTHQRRTEVYLYFDIHEDAMVFHLMGPADQTRHIAVGDGEAVVSPMWSIHSGVGTSAYTFCWGMGGENQEFDDMDHVEIKSLK
jgi:4-deoxy-L-threo-5-hexosulose-uronate ketol-isomerase